MIAFASSASGSPLPIEFARGNNVRNVVLPARLFVVNAETHVAAARRGLGLIQVPRRHVERDLAECSLARSCPTIHPRPRGIAAVPAQPPAVPRVQVFVEWLVQAFAPR